MPALAAMALGTAFSAISKKAEQARLDEEIALAEEEQKQIELDLLKKEAPMMSIIAQGGVPEELREQTEDIYDQRTSDIIEATTKDPRGAQVLTTVLPQLTQQEAVTQAELTEKGMDRVGQLSMGLTQLQTDTAQKSAAGIGAAKTAASELGMSASTDVASGLIQTAPMLVEKGAIIKTPGEFSHKANEGMIVFPTENGWENVGFVTGNEIVFNKPDAEKIDQLVEKEDKEGLFSLISDRVTQFEKESGQDFDEEEPTVTVIEIGLGEVPTAAGGMGLAAPQTEQGGIDFGYTKDEMAKIKAGIQERRAAKNKEEGGMITREEEAPPPVEEKEESAPIIDIKAKQFAEKVHESGGTDVRNTSVALAIVFDNEAQEQDFLDMTQSHLDSLK